MYKYFVITIITAVLCGCGHSHSNVSDGQAVSAHENAHILDGRGFIENWIVVGTFPSPEVDAEQPDGSRYLGFYKDYL